MRFVYGQRHAGVVLIAAEASGFTKIEERAVSERWILKRCSSSSEPSVVITRVLLARPFYVLYSFCTMLPAQHAMSEDPMDIDLQPEVEEIEPRGPKPIHRLTKDVINQIAAAEVRPRRVGNVF